MRSLAGIFLLLAAFEPFAAGQPRVVLVDIDGVRRDTFEKAYLSGKLPNFARILGEVRNGKGFGSATWFENATTVFPSVTMAAQASIFTGVQPARHGILGNQWFDRTTGRVINYMNSAGTPCVYGFLPVGVGDCAGGLANRHLQAPTLYEAATAAGKRSLVVFSQYWKGATRVVLPSLAEAGFLIVSTSVNYKNLDTTMMDRAIEALRHDGLPDILTVYFAGADGVGHTLGIPGQTPYLRDTIDPQIGRLLETFQALDADWRKHTLFVITSDHGRTDAPPLPEDKAIETHLRNVLGHLGYTTVQYAIAENGGLVHLYLRSRTPGARWTVPPRAEDVLAVAKELSRNTALGSVTESIVVHHSGYGFTAYGDTAALTSERAALLAGMDSPRAGDLLLLLKPGHYFGDRPPAGAQHGSVYSSDLSVPLALALGGTNPGRSPVSISTADIARIVAAYLGFTM